MDGKHISFENFIIRELDENDAEAFCMFILKNFSRIASSAPITVKAVTDVESARLFIRERKAKAERKELYSFTVFDKNINVPVANIVIMNIDWTIPKGEFGFYIDKDYEGKGIITKAVSVLTTYAFNEMHFQKLFMRISESNISSRRVAEKNNFEKEGILKKDFRNYNGDLVDVIYYGLCKSN
jgi:ribosomal-protein-serine acetyltransferase